ncbi:MAG TPA: hypothetical protein VF179_29130 [Thermoanaerobaculia bacterium]|nr:hypothetical protein [Thermoanaerobaculia bacterium]
MRGFRVELLHAEALPLRLLDSLNAVFESSDPLVRKAAESHRIQLEKHLEFIHSLDYGALTAEWDYWIGLFKNRHRNRQRLDPKKYLSLGNQIESFEGAYMLLNARFFSLVALGLFDARTSQDEVDNFLDGQSWATKHEVLTRWGWIKRHNELLTERKVELSAPYSCSLSRHGATFEQNDEEFYQLLSFLHILRFATGRELLFFAKGESPDFRLKDEKGCIVGAEMTEAWTSPTWTKEFIASAQMLQFLDQQLQRLGVPVHIHIEEPRSWRSLRRHREEIADWIVRNLVDIDIRSENVTLQNLDLKLKIKLSPTEGRPSISYGSFASSGPKTPDTDTQSHAMHASLQKTLRQKIKTPTPTAKPCYLVISPVHDLDTDLEKVVAEFSLHPTLDVSSHFSEVWLVSQRQAFQLI